MNTIFENSPGIQFEPIRILKFTETKYHLVYFIKIEDTVLIYTFISQMYKSAVLNCKNKNTHFCLEITNNDRFEENHKHWIHETLDFYILTLQNIPYDNLETNDTGLFETPFERSISTQTAIFLGKTPFESNIFVWW